MTSSLNKNTSLPPNYKLLPGESVSNIENYPDRAFVTHPPTALQALLSLTNASHPRDIGHTGPALAALAYKSGHAPVPDHLRIYKAIFGRDSLRVATDLMPIYPELAKTTIMTLARQQGIAYSKEREEEPGRIVHEIRDPHDAVAERLTKQLGWQWPYYGSVDATSEFIRAIATYCRLSPKHATLLHEPYIDRSGMQRTICYALEQAIRWIETRRSSNAEGLIESKSPLVHGIENQVWKDSWDAYHHADGELANRAYGVSSIEVQVSAYEALLQSAELYKGLFNDNRRASTLFDSAATLRETILTTYWTNEKDGYFVLGTDRDNHHNLRQLKIRTSNMGHVLNSQLLAGTDPEIVRKREALVKQLLSPELLNVSGIRTLASDEIRFRPGSYHNGSVWPWDTHYIAQGMRKHGYRAQAYDLDKRVLNVINKTRMYPEYVRGDSESIPHINTQTITLWDKTHKRENKIEQPPQEIQAWTVAAAVATRRRLSRSYQLTRS